MFRVLANTFIDQDKAMAFFAINNTCNCRCEMCGIWKVQNKKVVRLEQAKYVLDRLWAAGFRVVQLTGGEPLLNPHFFDIVEYAKDLGFAVFVVSNGTLITADIARRLKQTRVDQISISFHHHRPEVFERISGHPGIKQKVERAIEVLNDNKVPVSALCTVTRLNAPDLEDIAAYIDGMDIGLSFCTPMVIADTSYALGSSTTEFSRQELRDIIGRMLALKRRGYNIINNSSYLRDLLAFLDGQSKFHCLGGSRLWYIDWDLLSWPCMVKGPPVPLDSADFRPQEPCDRCLMQCFREPSLLLGPPRQTSRALLLDLPYYSIMCWKRLKVLLR